MLGAECCFLVRNDKNLYSMYIIIKCRELALLGVVFFFFLKLFDDMRVGSVGWIFEQELVLAAQGARLRHR